MFSIFLLMTDDIENKNTETKLPNILKTVSYVNAVDIIVLINNIEKLTTILYTSNFVMYSFNII